MKSFFDFFPTPKFLEMPAPGLALSDSGLKFVEFGKGPNGQTITHYGYAALPKGLIEAGTIVDQQALIKALENFRKTWSLHYIRTSLPEERAYLFQTTVPRVSDKELRTVVESTIEENVPLSVAEVIFDYNVLIQEKDAPKDRIKVSVSVIPEDLVLEYLSVFRSAGFTPLHFDIESQAVTKAVVAFGDQTVSLIVNLNKTKAGLYIVSNGAVAFTSTVPVAPPTASTAATTNGTVFNIATAIEDQDATVIRDYPALAGLVKEIEKVYLYWQTQAERENRRATPIEKIILCGEEAGRVGVATYIARALSTKVELANVWQNAFSLDHYVPPISLADSLSYAPAVGLALSRKDSV